jgi:hypothetical protein
MSAFRLPNGATAPYATLARGCMEIVFVEIRLCDRLKYARLNAPLFGRFGRRPPWALSVAACRSPLRRRTRGTSAAMMPGHIG